MNRYRITILVETHEDDPSAILDAIQDGWPDDWAGTELPRA